MKQVLFDALPDRKFQIIYADPPWDYKGQCQHNESGEMTGGARCHYPTIALDELKALSVRSIADRDCLLFMWTSNPHLDQAIELGKAWGFQWATVGFVWHKQAVNPGYYTMSACELCCIFKRGRIPSPRGARNVEQFLCEARTAHSAKPHEIRQRIDAMFPTQAKIELFARNRASGWSVWGNESVPLVHDQLAMDF